MPSIPRPFGLRLLRCPDVPRHPFGRRPAVISGAGDGHPLKNMTKTGWRYPSGAQPSKGVLDYAKVSHAIADVQMSGGIVVMPSLM